LPDGTDTALWASSTHVFRSVNRFSTNHESDCIMKTNIFNSAQAIWAGILLSAVVFAGASAVAYAQPLVLMPSTDASAVSPSGPADLQVAQRYGRIDHSSLMSASILPAPNPGPAAVAAYETPPQ
jgi:hypothetical protein